MQKKNIKFVKINFFINELSFLFSFFMLFWLSGVYCETGEEGVVVTTARTDVATDILL